MSSYMQIAGYHTKPTSFARRRHGFNALIGQKKKRTWFTYDVFVTYSHGIGGTRNDVFNNYVVFQS